MSNWDISLDGTGYMIAPGSYRASRVPGTGAGRDQRARIAEFAAGQTAGGGGGGGLFGIESSGAWPAPWPVGTSGIGPGPARQAAPGTVGTPSPKLCAANDDYLFVAAGTSLHRWPGSGEPVNRTTLPTAPVDLARRGDDIFLAYGPAIEVSRWNDAGGVQTPAVLGAGYHAHRVGGVGGLLVTAHATNRNQIDVWDAALSMVTSYTLSGEVRRMANYDDALIVATNQELVAIRGLNDATVSVEGWGILAEAPQAPDDFAWMTVFQGRLVAWVGGQVMIYDGSRASWSPAGLAGASTFGATVAGGWLFVAVLQPLASDPQLWAYDGAGWWLLSTNDYYPATAADGRLVTFQESGGTLSFFDPGSLHDAATLQSPFQFTTGLLDAGQPGITRDWRNAGIELVRVDGATPGSWDFTIEYSTDAGATWTSTGTGTVASSSATLEMPLEVSASHLRLRVTGERNSGLPPLVTAIWAEYGGSSGESARRRWEFQVHARDNGIDRDGALDARTGQEIRASLWDLAASGTLAYRDIDYATTLVERDVEIVDIREAWKQPFDQPVIGADTVLTIVIEEV